MNNNNRSAIILFFTGPDNDQHMFRSSIEIEKKKNFHHERYLLSCFVLAIVALVV